MWEARGQKWYMRARQSGRVQEASARAGADSGEAVKCGSMIGRNTPNIGLHTGCGGKSAAAAAATGGRPVCGPAANQQRPGPAAVLGRRRRRRSSQQQQRQSGFAPARSWLSHAQDLGLVAKTNGHPVWLRRAPLQLVDLRARIVRQDWVQPAGCCCRCRAVLQRWEACDTGGIGEHVSTCQARPQAQGYRSCSWLQLRLMLVSMPAEQPQAPLHPEACPCAETVWTPCSTAAAAAAAAARRTCSPPMAPISARSQMSAWQSSPAEQRCTALCGAQHTAFTFACRGVLHRAAQSGCAK